MRRGIEVLHASQKFEVGAQISCPYLPPGILRGQTGVHDLQIPDTGMTVVRTELTEVGATSIEELQNSQKFWVGYGRLT